MPGPITREYTFLDEALPPRQAYAKKDWDSEPAACVTAKIEVSNDLRARRTWATKAWARLRQVYPALVP